MASTNSKTILLTVVTPVALMAGRLQKLRSWLSNLGELPIEVILVHDKQDLDTGNELASITSALNDSRIKNIEGTYGGPGLARNVGLEAARGKWICFWDSDDLPQIDEFYAMVQKADELGAECVIGGFTAEHDVTHENKVHLLSSDFLREIAVNPGIWRFAFDRTIIGKLRFSSLLMAEDQIFLAELEIPTKKVEIYPRSVYRYFVGENFHLTRRKEALADLPIAIDSTFNILHKPYTENTDFVSMLLFRQVLTTIKKCNNHSKVRAIKAYATEMLHSPRNVKISLAKGTWRVLRTRESIL